MENQENNTEESVKEFYKNTMQEDIQFLKETDTFSFGCTRCGKCCRGYRKDIILNPYDIYNLSKALQLPGDEIIQKYCTVWFGDNSRVPIVGLSHDKTTGWCNFLEFNPTEGVFGCSVNDHKPGACRNHPIGIVREMRTSEEKTEESIKFFLTSMCSNHKEETQLVSNWMKDYLANQKESDAGAKLALYPLDYFDTMLLCDIIQRKGKFHEDFIKETEVYNFRQETFENLAFSYFGSTFSTLYNFDPARPFLDQIEERKEKFNEIIDQIIDLFHAIGIDLRKKEKE